MCMITLKPMGVKYPDIELLKNAEDHNKDGDGICFGDGKNVIIKKDFKNITDAYEWAVKNVPAERGVIFHQRFATHGLKDTGNRHPFPVTNNIKYMRKANCRCKLAFAHNGTFKDCNDKGNVLSDSMVFLKNYVAGLKEEQIYEKGPVQELLCKAVGFSRVAFMNPEGRIFMFGAFNKHENGCYFSNEQYKKEVYKTYSFNNGWGAKEWDKKQPCYLCGGHKKVKWVQHKYTHLCSKCRNVMYNTVTKGNHSNFCDACGVSDEPINYCADLQQWLCKPCEKINFHLGRGVMQ